MQVSDTHLFEVIENGDAAEIVTLLSDPNINLEARDADGNTIFHYVFKNKQLVETHIIEIFKILLDKGVDPKIQNHSGVSVFQLAIANRLKDVIIFLEKCNVTIGDFEGMPFIHFITENEYKKFWKMEGTNDDTIMRNREIMETVSANFIKWIVISDKFSTSYGMGKSGMWPGYPHPRRKWTSILTCAMDYDLLHILLVLLEYSKVKRYETGNRRTLLHDIFLLEKRKGKSEIDQNWYAAYRQRYVPQIINILLERGCSAIAESYCGLTPLRAAVESDEDVSYIEILLNYYPDGCDKNSLTMSFFCEMVRAKWSDSKADCYLKISNDLIARGVDVNGKNGSGMRPIQCAVKAKNLVTVRYLKNVGADFGVLTDDGGNLLHILAIEDGCCRRIGCIQTEKMLFDYLVSVGCQENATNATGDYVLHVAAKFGNLTIVQKLVDRGFEVDCKNEEMQTPLHLAPMNRKSSEVIEFLLDKGAKINMRDIQGRTPLHLAAGVSIKKVNSTMLKLLLSRGAYLDIQDKNDETPLAKAIKEKNDYNVKVLLEHGASINHSRTLANIANLDHQSVHNETLCNLLLQNWLKTKATKLACLPNYQEVFNLFGNCKSENFYDDCLKEVHALKETVIDGRTSLYDFLHMHPDSRYFHVNNEKLINIVESPKLKEQFPKYSVLILTTYREAVARKTLMEPAREAWLQLTGIRLPDICLNHILYFLNNDDLATIAEK